ncbi:hypothetical protein PSM7751_02724 [Pseudooceanicola marinus]|uniref:Uncharacterized protein n=1 Tax=Pseudooceanicola marinus TaxID=396013 RepID=A0A1X6ZMD8_9RHOB|nr:hypothetical protein [Pseudooceanicola marinus]PJE26602.1 hypothetical protein CVM50_18020 [Pseudooceanicola marinus]SLN55435.1 hypothetical protein PSM7751_02724 [Pseudooceanicola marinus]
MQQDDLNDRVGITDFHASRRYFRKFEAIMAHLAHVAAAMRAERTLSEPETEVLARHISALTFTFRALSMKYLLAGRDTGRFFGSLTIDNHESGFPTAQELMVMANDAGQAGKHLASMPSVEALKRQMLDQILSDHAVPTKTQFALSQRLYYEELARGDLFWPRNDPDAVWLENLGGKGAQRRRYLLHWSVYDSGTNLPVIYLMEVEDSGRTGLPKDQSRWPQVQAHLVAQSLGGLKLLTIAQGFDQDFDDLHPKRLRRIHIGPMYSHAFTRQSGPIRDVLEGAGGAEGEDWALAWTSEELLSERVKTEKSGWFGQVEREIFALDPLSGGAETGATSQDRALILPARPFQVLSELNPPGFARIRKFVVGAGDRVLRY